MREAIKDFSEVAKNFVEICALIGAGVWGYFNFVVKDKPTLIPHINGTASRPIWSAAAKPDFCQVVWTVSAQNTGNTSIDIHHVNISVWSFHPPEPKAGEVLCIDEDEMFPRDGKDYLYQKRLDLPNAPLTGHLDPTDDTAHDFRFFFPRTRTDDGIGFDIQFFERVNGQDKSLLYIYDIDTKRCEESPRTASP